MLATEAVIHRCSSTWLKTPTTLETPAQVFSSEICRIFKEQLFYRTPQVAVSVTITDQKKQKDILKYNTLQIFLLKHNDAKNIIRFNEIF